MRSSSLSSANVHFMALNIMAIHLLIRVIYVLDLNNIERLRCIFSRFTCLHCDIMRDSMFKRVVVVVAFVFIGVI